MPLDRVTRADPPWPGEDLRKSTVGPDVVVVQHRLAERGWDVQPDGDFGERTDTVVRAFQTEKGLECDGIVGRQTWDALWTAPIETPPPPA